MVDSYKKPAKLFSVMNNKHISKGGEKNMKRGPKNVVKRDDAINFLVSTGLTFSGKPRYGEYVFGATDGSTKTFTLKAMRQEYIKAKTPPTPADTATAPVVA